MKQVTLFDPTRNLIVVDGEISGPLGERALRLALDTGSSETLLVPERVDELGYSPRDAEIVTGVYSAVGKEQGSPRRSPAGQRPGVVCTQDPDPGAPHDSVAVVLGARRRFRGPRRLRPGRHGAGAAAGTSTNCGVERPRKAPMPT